MNLLKAIDILMKASTGGASFGSQTIGQPVTPGSYAPVLASSLQPKAEKIKGGKADGLTLSDIAKMHDVPLKDLRAQYAKGVKVEREHTESPAIAAEIALDHLYESPTYYSDLEKVEKAALVYSAYMDKSLGRKRDTMPQIDEGSLDDFLIHFAQKSGGEGVKIKKVVKKASALIPSQNEINDAKVLNWRKPDKPKPIIISKDNYIIDGHHQWAAALEDGDDSELVCIKVDLDAKELLRRANLLKIATKKDIEDRVMKAAVYVFEDEMVKAWSTDLAKRVNGKWVTMNGQPVLIGSDGNVHAGPEKVINAIFDKFEKSINLFDAFDILLKAKTDKVATVMREFKEGELTTHGKPVADRKQAIAIALNEAGLSKAEVKFEDMKDDELYDLYSQGGDKVYSGISAATMRKVYDAYDGKITLAKSAISKSSQTFSDYPQSATNAAKRAIEWKEKHGDEVKAGTQVGWTRAHQLANREPLSLDTVKRIAQFARHLKNASVDPKYKDEPWKDRGHVAVLLWGGEDMINWAKRTVEKHENI